jgi:ornithine carbamoyltransferase
MIVTYPRLAINLKVATPKAYTFDRDITKFAQSFPQVTFTNDPLEAVKNANVIVTDTWISMGQESEKEQRLKNFEGWQITENMAKNAHPDWKFMHCLPRKTNEVDDAVFYNEKRSVVFQEAV